MDEEQAGKFVITEAIMQQLRLVDSLLTEDQWNAMLYGDPSKEMPTGVLIANCSAVEVSCLDMTPKTLRRKLQKKAKRLRYRLCSKCGGWSVCKLVDMQVVKWCRECKTNDVRPWTGKPG